MVGINLGLFAKEGNMSDRGSFVSSLRRSKPLIGTLVSVRSPEVAEALALCGYDWLFLDLEHSTIDVAAAQTILQAVGTRVYAVLRLPDNNPEHFKKALDTGCDGVVIPLVNSAHEAEAAVRAAKYPPMGNRSVGIGRAHGYGLSFASYVEEANSSVALILQIEHRSAVEQIDAIVAVKGFDAIFVGPYDLLLKALKSKRPRARYHGGYMAGPILFLKWLLPDRAMDWILAKTMQ